jgi:hypothetical protein
MSLKITFMWSIMINKSQLESIMECCEVKLLLYMPWRHLRREEV